MLAQYYVFVYVPRTKVEALERGRRGATRLGTGRSIGQKREGPGTTWKLEALVKLGPIPRPMFAYR